MVAQTEFSELAVPVDSPAGVGAGDAHFRGDVGDGAVLAVLDESAAHYWGHGRVLQWTGWWCFSSCR